MLRLKDQIGNRQTALARQQYGDSPNINYRKQALRPLSNIGW